MQTQSKKVTGDEWRVTSKAKPRSVFSNFKSEIPSGEENISQATTASSETTPFRSLQEMIDEAVARSFLYRFVAKAFEDPARESRNWLTSPQTQAAARLALFALAKENNGALNTSAETLLAKLALDEFENLKSDYLSAFGHTVRGDCPLNEIEYGDIKADPLFQPHRLADLGAFYRAFGLEVAEDAAERHDHICLELEFMSVLTAKEAYALEHQLEDGHLALCRDAQKKFLREHLGRWTPAFTRRLARIVADGALGALANFTREFISAECARFGLTPGSEDLLLRPVDTTGESLCDSCGIATRLPGMMQPCGET